MRTRKPVMILSNRTWTSTPVLLISAFRKAPPTSIVITFRFSAAAMAATHRIDVVEAVGPAIS